MKPLVPAADAAGMVREAGFALLLRDHRPVELGDLALATGIDVEVARARCRPWRGPAGSTWTMQVE